MAATVARINEVNEVIRKALQDRLHAYEEFFQGFTYGRGNNPRTFALRALLAEIDDKYSAGDEVIDIETVEKQVEERFKDNPEQLEMFQKGISEASSTTLGKESHYWQVRKHIEKLAQEVKALKATPAKRMEK